MPWLVPAQPLNAADGEYEQLPQLRLADGAEPAEEAFAPGGAQAFDAIIAAWRGASTRCLPRSG